jgi:hypothetical protein
MSSFDFAEFERELKRMRELEGSRPSFTIGDKIYFELGGGSVITKEEQRELQLNRLYELEKKYHELTALLDDLKEKFGRWMEYDVAQLCILKRKHPYSSVEMGQAKIELSERQKSILNAKIERYIQLHGSNEIEWSRFGWGIPRVDDETVEASFRRADLLRKKIAAIQLDDDTYKACLSDI